MKKHNTADKIAWAVCILACIATDYIAINHDLKTFITMVVLEIICVFALMVEDNL